MTDGKPQGQRDWRWIALYIVAIGGMSVSISGQVQSIEHQLGGFLAVVFAATNDVGAILALDIALGAAGGAIKKWAWVAILLAAGTGAALNAYHAMSPAPATPPGVPPVPAPPLPTWLAILVGAEPVILVLILSHLIGLVVAARRGVAVPGYSQPGRQPGSQVASQPQPASQPVTARVGDSQATTITARQTAPVGSQAGGSQVSGQVVGSQAPNSQGGHRQAGDTTRPALPAARQTDHSPSRVPARPARALTVAPEPRLPWMTDELIAAVVKARRADPRYGRKQIATDHQIGTGQVRSLLDFIDKHGLMRETA